MTQASNERIRPKLTGFMAGWLVFVGFYQMFLAAKHGGLFFGDNSLLQQDISTMTLSIAYAVMGVLFMIIAYGIWNLRWWAYPLGLVVQGMVISLALVGITRWLAAGQQAPIIWDSLDLIFAAINLSWVMARDVRTVFTDKESGA